MVEKKKKGEVKSIAAQHEVDTAGGIPETRHKTELKAQRLVVIVAKSRWSIPIPNEVSNENKLEYAKNKVLRIAEQLSKKAVQLSVEI